MLLEKERLHDIMTTCIILLNVIIENEYDLYAPIQDVIEAPTTKMVVDEISSLNIF